MANHKFQLLAEEAVVWWRNNENCHTSHTPLSKLCRKGFPSVADLDQSSLHTNGHSTNQIKPSTRQLSYLALFDWFLKLDEPSTHHAVVIAQNPAEVVIVYSDHGDCQQGRSITAGGHLFAAKAGRALRVDTQQVCKPVYCHVPVKWCLTRWVGCFNYRFMWRGRIIL